jgi:hypothetical protein
MWCCYYNNKLFKFKTVEALKEFFNVDLPEERPVDIGDSDSEKEMEVSE